MKELFNVDLAPAVRALKEANAKRVLLQLPEGLKTRATELAARLEKEAEVEAVVFTDPCFGACDLPLHERELLKCDFILHLGHNAFMKAGNTLYVPLEYRLSEKELQKTAHSTVKELKKRSAKSVGVLCTVNFYSHAEKFSKLLEKEGFKTRKGKGFRTMPMQLLGCDQRAAASIEQDVDAFVFLADGVFHPIGVALSTNKTLLLANPRTGKVEEFSSKEREKYVRRRSAAIARVKDAKVFGVLVTTKVGQLRLGEAVRMKELLEKHGKKAVLLAGDLLVESSVAGIEVDAFVCTGCPRIAVDDGLHWKKPLLNPVELEVALGEKPFEALEKPMDF